MINAVQSHSLGFAPSESGLLFVVDPTALQPYLRDGVMEEWIAASLACFGEGNHEVPLGTDGGQAVAIYGASRGRHVLVKESLEGDRRISLSYNVRDAQ